MTLVMSPTESAPGDAFMSLHAARNLMGCTVHVLYSRVIAGRIRVRIEPGFPPKFHRGDVQRIAAEK